MTPMEANARDAMAKFAMLGERFAGTSLDQRTVGVSGWNRRWRARIHTHKYSNVEYRIEVWGDTWEDTVHALIRHVELLDMGMVP